jgi:hypothetical protein
LTDHARCLRRRLRRPLHLVSGSWVHEIKHDGYRLIVRRDGEAVRLFTRRGYDWTERYPPSLRRRPSPRRSHSPLMGRRAPAPTASWCSTRSTGTAVWPTPFYRPFDLLELDGVDYPGRCRGKSARIAWRT